MDFGQLLAAIIGMLTLAGGIIGVYVEGSKKIALSRQANAYTQRQVDKLEQRLDEMENNIYNRLDLILDHLQKLEIKFAQRNNNQ
jgi:hypothetical protein